MTYACRVCMCGWQRWSRGGRVYMFVYMLILQLKRTGTTSAAALSVEIKKKNPHCQGPPLEWHLLVIAIHALSKDQRELLCYSTQRD